MEYTRLGPVMPPEDKDAALFPRRFDGRWALIHRPSPQKGPHHIWISYSPDLRHWGDHTAAARRTRRRLVGCRQDRPRPTPDRDGRRLADPVPRRPPDRQRFALPGRPGPARPRRPADRPPSQRRVGLRPDRGVRAGRRRGGGRLPLRLDRRRGGGPPAACTTGRRTRPWRSPRRDSPTSSPTSRPARAWAPGSVASRSDRGSSRRARRMCSRAMSQDRVDSAP